MWRNVTELQVSQHVCRATEIFCGATRVSCRVGVTICIFIRLEVAIHAFSVDYLCSFMTYDIIFCCCRPALDTYSIKQPDLYYFKAIKMTPQAWSKFTENTRLRLVFSRQHLTRLLTSFVRLQNSIDQAVS